MKTCLLILAFAALVTAGCQSDMNANDKNAPAYQSNPASKPLNVAFPADVAPPPTNRPPMNSSPPP
jgi:uncharacterized lipoprotein